MRVLERALDLDDAAVAHGEVEAALGRGVADGADRLAHLDARVRPRGAWPSACVPCRPRHALPHRRERGGGADAAARRQVAGRAAERPQQRARPAHVSQQIEAYQPPARRTRAPRRSPSRSSTSKPVRRRERAAAGEQQVAGVLDVAGRRRRGRRPSTPAMTSPAVRPCRRALDHRATTQRSPLTGSSVRATSPAASSPGAAVRSDRRRRAPRRPRGRSRRAGRGWARPGADDDQVEARGRGRRASPAARPSPALDGARPGRPG